MGRGSSNMTVTIPPSRTYEVAKTALKRCEGYSFDWDLAKR